MATEDRSEDGSAGSMEGEQKADDDVELLPRPFGGYMLLAVLGHGGMGKVYLAARERIAGIARRCVVKTLRPGFGDDREYVTRFLDEARIVAQLHHRCICPVFDVGKSSGQHYIVMEYIAGRDLRTLLRRARAKGVRIDREMTLHIMGEVLEALDYAHRTTDPASGAPLALVHRDVSPQNVMIGFEGDVRLIDFGLAASTLKTERTAPNMVMGKVAYMSPEQIYGEQIDARADQFAAGVMAYELLMDERFYEKRVPREVYQAAAAGRHRPKKFDDLPGDLRVVLDRALAFDRVERYATCGAFRESLVSGRPRADAPTLRKLMEAVFADEILEEKRLVARLAASSSQPTAPAPDGHALETSMPASAMVPASRSAPLSTKDASKDTDKDADREANKDASFDDFDRDGTVETGSAPAARASEGRDGRERTDAVRRASGTVPDREVNVSRSRTAARLGLVALLAVALAAFAMVTQWPDGDTDGDAGGDGNAAVVAPVPVNTPVIAPPVVAPVVAPVMAPHETIAPVETPVVSTAPAVKKPVKKPVKTARPPKNALPGAVIRYLEQRCPSLPCAKNLVAHKNDWADLPIQQLRADLDQCVARCEK